MIGLVVATIVVTSLITVPLTYLWMRRPRPAMAPKERRLLDQSMSLIWQFLHPTSMDRMDMLSEESRKAAEKLLNRYEKEIT